jgi:general secretion pathway protein E
MVKNELVIRKNESKFISYTYAKRNGVIISGIQDEMIKIIYRSDCSPYTLIELRRYLMLPLYFEESKTDYFTSLLTQKYELKSIAASEVAENISEDLDLQLMLKNIPTATDILEDDNDAPVILLVNALLREAIKKYASDIHFETFEKSLVVRFRIDGVLDSILDIPYNLAPMVISRIKVMAKLNISEKRLPQDGRLTVNIAGRTIDVRVSVIPVSHGERVVLRLFNKNAIQLNLAELGMGDAILNVVRKILVKTHGIIVVTGPTGSGKTTTLYAMLTELNVPDRNILTIEDPVEYDLPGIGQIQVNPKIDMTFAKGLRAILRQDPNVVMIGEIRDLETAVIATQASLTGHLVFTTLHTNTAIGTITRLRDMGVESFLLSSSLVGIISQRLLRLLCKKCKDPYIPTQHECELLGIVIGDAKNIYKPRGCSDCNNTGYRNRIGLYEVIMIDYKLREMIHEDASEPELEKYARTLSPSINQNGYQRVLQGDTSIDELLRIISE